MPKPAFVVGSDNHIEYAAYASYSAMWGDSHFAFKQEVDKALELGVPLVLAGDVFDKAYPDPYSLRVTFHEITRLERAGIPLYYSQGQHELSRKAPWLSLHPHPIHLHGHAQFINPFVVAGMDWQPADLLANTLKHECFKAANILICHQVWAEFMGPQTAPEGSIVELVPPNIHTVITGDFHGHKVKELPRGDSGSVVRILSPGSATLQAIGEDPNKYFFVVYDDGSLQSVGIRNRRVIYSRAFTEAQLREEVERFVVAADVAKDADRTLPENLVTPMWVAQYHYEIPDAAKILKAAAAGKAHLFLRPFGKEQEQEPERTTSHAVSGLGEALATLVDRSTPEYNTALRLLSAQDVKAELALIVEECINDKPKPRQELPTVGPELVEPAPDAEAQESVDG